MANLGIIKLDVLSNGRQQDRVLRHMGDVRFTSFIYTDFLVTIMEAKNQPREVIKSMIVPETKKLYIRLFDLYRESDRS